MQNTENGPGVSARAVNNQENSHVAGSSVPPSSVPIAPIIRISYSQKNRLVIVQCPYCGHEHTHGWPGGSTPGHRVAHCNPPSGTWYRQQRLEVQRDEFQYVVDRLIDNYSDGELTFEQIEKRIKAPLERLKATTAKLQAINDRYPSGANYYIAEVPAGPATQESGSAQ